MTDLPKPADSVELPKITAIDLALSGGGFRATLFHLGVIGFLRDRNLLRRVDTICSVSGGSILAAHLVSYWNDYISDDDDVFRSRVRQLVTAIVKRDLSGEVLKGSKKRIRRFRPLDSEILATAYRRLLGNDCEVQRWDDLHNRRKPRVHILATHLNTGQAGAFTEEGFHLLPIGEDQRHAEQIKAFARLAEDKQIGHQDIARAVAASSAFPPVFSPIPLVEDDTTHANLLTDGGVYDNSGVKYLQNLYEIADWSDSRHPMVIVSDAGREFPTELGPGYDTLMALILRVTDAQANRIAEADSRTAKEFFGERHIPVLRLSIQEPIEYFKNGPANHSVKVQELLSMIRTELDQFTREEAFVLYRHGFLVAQKRYAKDLTEQQKECPAVMDFDVTLKDVPWTPVDATDTQEGDEGTNSDLRTLEKNDLENALQNGHVVKKLGQVASSLRSRVLLVVAALLITGLVLGAVIGYYCGSRATTRVPVRGTLRIAEVKPYHPDGWAAGIPMLAPVIRSPEPQYVYSIATEPMGTLTNGQPYDAAVAGFHLQGKLGGAKIYLLLEQETLSGESQYLVLVEASTKRVKIPAGKASDRLRGIIVSQTELSEFQVDFEQNLNITLETP